MRRGSCPGCTGRSGGTARRSTRPRKRARRRTPSSRYDGGRLRVRYYDDYVANGYGLAGEGLDGEGRAALDALRAILDDPANWVEFRIERGQLQYLSNARFAHCRTAFVDDPGPDRRRHLLRLWNREEGTPHLEGRLPA